MTETHSIGSRPRMRPHIALRIRRAVAVTILLAFGLGLYWVVFRTQLLTPLLAYAEPIEHGIAWVKEDPMRLAYAAVAVILPHLGLYMMIFGDD